MKGNMNISGNINVTVDGNVYNLKDISGGICLEGSPEEVKSLTEAWLMALIQSTCFNRKPVTQEPVAQAKAVEAEKPESDFREESDKDDKISIENDWNVILDFFKSTDPDHFERVGLGHYKWTSCYGAIPGKKGPKRFGFEFTLTHDSIELHIPNPDDPEARPFNITRRYYEAISSISILSIDMNMMLLPEILDNTIEDEDIKEFILKYFKK